MLNISIIQVTDVECFYKPPKIHDYLLQWLEKHSHLTAICSAFAEFGIWRQPFGTSCDKLLSLLTLTSEESVPY